MSKGKWAVSAACGGLLALGLAAGVTLGAGGSAPRSTVHVAAAADTETTVDTQDTAPPTDPPTTVADPATTAPAATTPDTAPPTTVAQVPPATTAPTDPPATDPPATDPPATTVPPTTVPGPQPPFATEVVASCKGDAVLVVVDEVGAVWPVPPSGQVVIHWGPWASVASPGSVSWPLIPSVADEDASATGETPDPQVGYRGTGTITFEGSAEWSASTGTVTCS